MRNSRNLCLVAVALPILLCAPSCMSYPGPKASQEQIAALGTLTHQVNGQEVGALFSGSETGPRVIYVHGSPGSAESWADFLIPAPDSLEAIALDRPGYGRSNHRKQGTVASLAEQAQALQPWLVERNGRWPVLVGHSLGGPIIAKAAVDYPDQVAGLVIIAGSLDPGLERLRWYNYVAKGLSWVLPTILKRSNEEMWPLKRELRALAEELSAVTCPVLIVHGTKDKLVPFENVAFMRAAFSASSHVEELIYEGAGHFLIWEEPYLTELRERIHAMAVPPLGPPNASASPPINAPRH